MSRRSILAGAALLASLWPITAAGAADTEPAACGGSVGGFELTPMPEHSGVGQTGVMCNYSLESTDQHLTSGMAVTIEYACPKETEEAFKSKTGPRTLYDRSAHNTRGEVRRTGRSLLVREDRDGEGYAGPFTVQEKMFLLMDSQTIGTIVVLTDVKPPPPSQGDAPPQEANPDELILSADQAVGVAEHLAAAYARLKSNLSCAAGGSEGTGGGGGGDGTEEAPKDMALEVKLDLVTESGRPAIPYGETVKFPVKVSARSKEKNEPVKAKHFAPLEVELRKDDVAIEKRTTDEAGSVTFEFTPPEDTPEECKTHRFKAVATREGVGTAEATLEAELQRGECERVLVTVTRNGADLAADQGPILFSPSLETTRYTVEARLQPERTPKYFRFRLAGALASSATIEGATPTGTPGEWEVQGVAPATVTLVISPLSNEMVDGAGSEPPIRVQAEASKE